MSGRLRDFQEGSLAAAQTTGASAVDAAPNEGMAPNFYQAVIRLRDDELVVVCNRTFPIVAFVSHPINMAGVQPVEATELAESFSNSGFEIASACDLLRPIVPEDLSLLTETERTQARYWKPETVGQIVFNWWD